MPKILPDTLPEGATLLKPAELNKLRFSSKRTILTAEVLEAAAKAAASAKGQEAAGKP